MASQVYDLNLLFAEAEASGLYIQFFEHRYWRECHDLQWCCWLRSKTNPTDAKKGEGVTAGEALNSALNKALSYDPLPEIKITGFTHNLSDMLKDFPQPKPKPKLLGLHRF